MNRAATEFVRRYATRIVALAVVLVLYGFARLPDISDPERALLAARFHFTQVALPEMPSSMSRSVRAVNPSLEHVSAWISSVGAAVAVGDFDGDGLANDVCHVDPRNDRVIVSAAPGTPQRYSVFTLSPASVRFDPATMAPMGCLPGDLNEDGRTDLLVYYWGRTPLAFLRRVSDSAALGAAAYVPQELVPGSERWFSNAATMADVDGDGHADLIIGNYFPDGARVLDAKADNMESMQDSMSRAYNGGSKRFLLWTRNGFVEADAGLDEKVDHGWTLAIGAADLDGDLLPEVYFANDFGPDRLLHNRSTPGTLRFAVLEGQSTLTTPSSKVLGRDSFKGMGVDFADLNGDGLSDIYVSNIAQEYALEESHFAFISTGKTDLMGKGIAPYVDRSEALGLSRSAWSWDAKLDDFDNDGVAEAIQATGFVKGEVDRWPELQELALGNDELLRDPRAWLRVQPGDDLSGHVTNPFFVRGAHGRYIDIARDLGLDQPQLSRGIATADVDGDGDLDFLTANQWGPSYLFRNDCPACGAFMGLHLVLPLASPFVSGAPSRVTVESGHPRRDMPTRVAIGASARVFLPDGRVLVAQVDGGNGHSGKRSPELHFGLGRSTTKDPLRVELRWRDPNGAVREQSLHLPAGWHTVRLG